MNRSFQGLLQEPFLGCELVVNDRQCAAGIYNTQGNKPVVALVRMDKNIHLELFPRAHDVGLARNYSAKDGIQPFFSFLKSIQHVFVKMGFLDDIDVF